MRMSDAAQVVSQTPGSVLNTTPLGANMSGREFPNVIDGRSMWVWCEAGMVTITFVIFYICACFTRFVWTERRKTSENYRVRQEMRKSVTANETKIPDRCSRQVGQIVFPESGSRSRHKRFMNYMCLFATFSTLTKFVVDQMKFFPAWNARSNSLCELLYDITDIFLFMNCCLGVYGFLWLKQWIFYSNPAVKGLLYHRFVVKFSKVFVVVIMFLSVLSMVSNIIPTRYQAGNSTAPMGDWEALREDRAYVGCVAIYDMGDPDESWPLLTYAALASTFQGILLALFIYPVVRQRIEKMREKKQIKEDARGRSSPIHEDAPDANYPSSTSIQTENEGSKCSVDVEKGSVKNSPTKEAPQRRKDTIRYQPGEDNGTKPRLLRNTSAVSDNALRSIRRAIAWTLVCVVTDLTLVGGFARFSKGTPQILTAFVTNVDLLFNIICIVATYSRWREILFPMCKCSKNKASMRCNLDDTLKCRKCGKKEPG